MSEMAIGMIGLGVMGRNLALNIEEKGFSVSAWDAWPEPVDSFVAASQGNGADAADRLNELLIQYPVHPQLSGHDGQLSLFLAARQG